MCPAFASIRLPHRSHANPSVHMSQPILGPILITAHRFLEFHMLQGVILVKSSRAKNLRRSLLLKIALQ